jgi:membrane-associated phospholipid phosphatase
MQPISASDARLRLYCALALCHVAVAALLPFSKVKIDYASFATAYYAAAPFIVINAYAIWRKAVWVSDPLDLLLAGWFAMAPITVSTYLAIGVGMPLADQKLVALDASLGFEWRALIAYVDARPVLSELLGRAYTSFFPQLGLIPLYLAFTGQRARAYATLTGFMLLCFASSLVSVWYPALGTYMTYGVGPCDVVNIQPKFAFFFLDQFYAVHGQPEFVLTASKSAGILTFPSVHAGVAGLCAWAAWSDRLLRYPILILNGAMAVSAISHASHYLIDVIAGLCIAAVCVWCAKALFFKASPASSALNPALASA